MLIIYNDNNNDDDDNNNNANNANNNDNNNNNNDNNNNNNNNYDNDNDNKWVILSKRGPSVFLISDKIMKISVCQVISYLRKHFIDLANITNCNQTIFIIILNHVVCFFYFFVYKPGLLQPVASIVNIYIKWT